MSTKRILLVLATVALAGVLVAVLAWAIWAPKPRIGQSIRFPDGDETTLLGVTYGTNNTLVLGRPYQKYLYGLLPAKIKSWSGARVVAPGTIGGFSSNSPMFWVEELYQDPKTGRRFVPGFNSLDEFATESRNESAGTVWSRLSDLDSVAAYRMEPTGPHGRIVGVVFYDSGQRTNRLGRFVIPGTTLPPARPANETAMAEVNEPGLRFQLLSLVTGYTNVATNYSTGANGLTFTQALFHLTQDEQPAKDWLPVGIEATDRDGNYVHPRFTLIGNRDGDLAYNFEGTLDPAKGPWKLRIQFRQSLSLPKPGWGPAHYAEFSAMPVGYAANAAGGK